MGQMVAIYTVIVSGIETAMYMQYKSEYWLYVLFPAWMFGAYLSMFIEMISFLIIRKNTDRNSVLMRRLMLYFTVKGILTMPLFIISAVYAFVIDDVNYNSLFFCACKPQ